MQMPDFSSNSVQFLIKFQYDFFGTERIDFEIHMKNVKDQDTLGE